MDPTAASGFRISLQPDGSCFTARPGETLLQAAHRAGIELESACRNGTCRQCIAKVQRGSTAFTIEWPGLLPEEKSAGWVLPCVTRATSDLVLSPGADAQ